MLKSKKAKTKGITLIALVITIIVLLILAGVTIAMLTGQNGILSNATKSKEETQVKSAEEKVKLAIAGSYDETGNMNAERLQAEVERIGGELIIEGNNVTVEIDGYSFPVNLVLETGPIEQPENTPEYWEATRKTDSEWYSYVDIGSNTKVRVKAPQLKGNMIPIKYTGENQEGSKWANVMTTDGSMWVWIPRYAYKITEGYHTDTAGTIEVAFLDTNNQFLNSSDTGTIETDPSKVTYTNNSQDQWLVHPAFTANADNGGGFGEVAGMWVAKFEASGTDETNLAVKPGVSSMTGKVINQYYHYGKEAMYGETQYLNSHMMKNSEWGVVAYLTHSKYGRNKEELAANMSSYTGGATDKNVIYKTNKNQSTTNNATGIYDISGGFSEHTASYVNSKDTNLQIYGGIAEKDLYGATEEEQNTSTAWKTVYAMGDTDGRSPNYEANKGVKGDAVYETSNSSGGSSSWYEDYSNFPCLSWSFFDHGGNYNSGSGTGAFNFGHSTGERNGGISFRPALTF